MGPDEPSSPSGSPPPDPERVLLRDPGFLGAMAIAVIVALGFGLVIPVLPLFARQFDVGLFAVTAVISVFALVRLVSNLYTGGLTDQFGPRRAIGAGALMVAVSSLLIAGAPNYWALLAFRGVGGFGSALFSNAIMTQVVSTVAPHQRGRAVGLLQGAFLFGIAFGPSVGGLLAAPLGLRWPFAIYAVFCAASGVIALVVLPRHGERAFRVRRHVSHEAPGADALPQAPAPGVRQLLRTTRDLCADPAFVAALAMMAASRWSAAGVRLSLIPVFGDEVVGASPVLVGVALTLAAVVQVLLMWPAGKIIDTKGRRALAAPAYFGFAVIAALVGFADTVPAFLVVMALYGGATGLAAVTPPAVVGDLAPPEQTGVAVGALNTAGDLGSVLGPLVTGYLAEAAGYPWAFGVSAALLAAAGIRALRMRETLPGAGAPYTR